MYVCFKYQSYTFTPLKGQYRHDQKGMESKC